MSASRHGWIGEPVTRLEDRPLVTGRGRFAGDIDFPHQLHMRMVRSSYAHGELKSIDASAALGIDGVVAVWTAQDVAELPPIDFREGSIEKLAPFRQPVLAASRVRYVGEPIAAVFAEDPYVAEDGAELVLVDVDELDPLLDATALPSEFLPGHSSEATVCRQGFGDVDAAFRDAHAVLALDLSVGRHSGVPLETRGRSGAMMPRATCWSCTARPRCRIATANCLHACSASVRPVFTSMKATSAAASASAVRFIRKMCWCSSLPSALAGP